MVPVPALAPCRAQRGRLMSAAAGAQVVQHAARVLLATGEIRSALPAVKALLTTLAKLLVAPCVPSSFRAELEVRRRGVGRRGAPRARSAATALRAPAHDHVLRGAGRTPCSPLLRTC